MRYLIILEPTPTGFSAYSPDLEGCVAAGDDREETIALMREAIAFHLEGLAAAGEPVPAPSSESPRGDHLTKTIMDWRPRTQGDPGAVLKKPGARSQFLSRART